jgi:hypothetical protein
MAGGELHRRLRLVAGEGVPTSQRRRDAWDREGRRLGFGEARSGTASAGVRLWLIVAGGLTRGSLAFWAGLIFYLYVNEQRICLQHMHVYLPKNFATNMYSVAEYVLLYGGSPCSALSVTKQ